MVVERRPRPRVRVFGCCLPIPLGMGLLSMGGLALLVRRTKRNPAGRDMDQMSSKGPEQFRRPRRSDLWCWLVACQDLNLGPHPYQAYSRDAF